MLKSRQTNSLVTFALKIVIREKIMPLTRLLSASCLPA